MKESTGLKKAWELLSEMVEGPIQDLNDTETAQFLFDMTALETRSRRVIRGLGMRSEAKQVVQVDDMQPGEEHVSIVKAIAEGEASHFPILLESRNALPLMVKITSSYRYPLQVGAGYEVPMPTFLLSHLVDWHQPVRLVDILNRVMQIDFVEGRKTILDDLPGSKEQEISFSPGSGPVELIREEKLGVVIEAEHARDMLRLTIRKEG